MPHILTSAETRTSKQRPFKTEYNSPKVQLLDINKVPSTETDIKKTDFKIYTYSQETHSLMGANTQAF